MGRPGVCVLIYMAGQWRDVATFYGGRRRATARCRSSASWCSLAILVAVNYLAIAAEQALGPDREPGLQPVGSDGQDPAEPGRAGEDDGVRSARRRLDHASATGWTAYYLPSPQGHRRVHRCRATEPAARQGRRDRRRYGTASSNTRTRTERVTTIDEQNLTNGIIKAMTGEQRKVYFTQGHGEKDTGEHGSYWLQPIASGAGQRQLRCRAAGAGAAARRAGRRHGGDGRGAADRLPAARDRRDGKKYLASGGKVLFMIDPPERPRQPRCTPLLDGFARSGASTSATTSSSMPAASGSCSAPTPRCRWPATYPPHPITDASSVMTAYPLARSVDAVEGGVNGRIAAAVGADQRAELGRGRPRGARQGRWTGGIQRRQGR